MTEATKDAFAGKQFDLTELEREVLALRGERAAELEAQAQQLLGQAKTERQIASERVKHFACERTGVPEDRKLKWKFKDHLPVSFEVLPLEEEPTAEEGDCGCPETPALKILEPEGAKAP